MDGYAGSSGDFLLLPAIPFSVRGPLKGGFLDGIFSPSKYTIPVESPEEVWREKGVGIGFFG